MEKKSISRRAPWLLVAFCAQGGSIQMSMVTWLGLTLTP